MNARNAWSRILILAGAIAMMVGAVDPLEGSLLILPGSGLVTVGTVLNHGTRRMVLCWTCIFVLIAFGVGALFLLSAWGGIGGPRGHSKWWAVLILPYPAGWLMGMVSLAFRFIRFVRPRRPPPCPAPPFA